MEKVKLSKSELAMLDALIADLQEETDQPSVLSDQAVSAPFTATIARLVMNRITHRAMILTVKVTPIAARAAGHFLTGSGTSGAQGLSDVMGSDGETLSVDQLIKLRKAAHS